MVYIDKISTYLVYLLPFALLTGPFIPDLIVTITSVLFLFTLNNPKKSQYLNSNFFKFFIILYLYLILSSVLSEYIYSSLSNSLVYVRFIIFALVIWYIIDHEENFLKNFTFSLMFGFFIAIIAGSYQYYNGYTITGEISRFDRLNLLFSDEQLLGHYMSRLFPLLTALLIINFKHSYKLFIFVITLFVMIDVLVYLSGERTSLGIMILGSIIIILFASKFRVVRIVSVIVSIGVIIFISSVNSPIKERNIDKTIEEMGFKSDSERVYLFSKVHEGYIFTSWNMFKDNKLLGIGPSNFRKLCSENDYGYNENSCSTHPHNIPAQVLSETGIIGMIFLLSITIYILSHLFMHIKSKLTSRDKILSDYQISLIACIICSLWPFLPSLNLFNNWINVIFFLPVGFLLQSFRNSYKK